jgi:hypothetical protein
MGGLDAFVKVLGRPTAAGGGLEMLAAKPTLALLTLPEA